MTPETLARVHASAFAGTGRAWQVSEFQALLGSAHVFVAGSAEAFALGRAVAGEAELLTLACDPAHQRKGQGRAALRAFEAEAQRRGAERFFLEVADDNAAALTLYQSEGYVETARRAGYYVRPDGALADAIVMEKIA